VIGSEYQLHFKFTTNRKIESVSLQMPQND
jgi:hypothetical protein